MFKDYDVLAERVLDGDRLDRADALAVLACPDAEVLDLVAAAGRVRRAHFDNLVKVNYLVNLKSGMCPEDCGYCSQRLGSDADVLKYSWLSTDDAVRQASAGLAGGASRVCLVSSGRGPGDRDVERVASIVDALRAEKPDVEVCACLGLLKDGQAERLAEAGVDAYNHNLNTAESHYESICSTHTYADRVDTVSRAQAAGMSACSGLIVGLGETDDQLVDALFALRDIGSDSVPVNFLMPFDGTPLQGTWELDPLRCLRILALARLVCPATEVRMAGGREMHLRSLQPLALHVANSLFLGDYLTSEGQAAKDDLQMIADNGFAVLGADPSVTHPSPVESAPAAQAPCGAPRPEPAPAGPVPVAIRRRGAGTVAAPNA